MQRRGFVLGLCFTLYGAAALAATAAVGAGAVPVSSGTAEAAARAAVVPAPEQKVAEPQKPVQITADAAEYFNKDGLVVFTGNVVAVQGDATISADRMEVSFVQSATTGPQPAGKPEPKLAGGIGSPSNAQRMSTIVALGSVKFRQLDPESKKERFATGDKGVYDVEKRLVTLSGNPRLWEGKNVIVGEEMVFNLDDKKMVVNHKVTVTFFPDDIKGVKKP